MSVSTIFQVLVGLMFLLHVTTFSFFSEGLEEQIEAGFWSVIFLQLFINSVIAEYAKKTSKLVKGFLHGTYQMMETLKNKAVQNNEEHTDESGPN